MDHQQKEPEGLPPFIPNWVLGASLLSLATAVWMGVYCQKSSVKYPQQTVQQQVTEILVQPKKDN